jgi:hypothetical protein
MSRRALLLSVVLLSASACAVEAPPSEATSRGAADLSEGEAAALLAFVNYPGTTRALLDDTVGLDSRAAENIVRHRDGADAEVLNADDDPFDDVAELDAVSYVGESALAKLAEYAAAHPAPMGEVVEGVTFSGWETEAVIWGVNHATVAELDLDVGLDSRAAENLVAGAPYASITNMGPIGYVGPAALVSLKTHARSWWLSSQGSPEPQTLAGTFDGVEFDETTAKRAIDIANAASFDQLVSHGVYSVGADAIVGARPHKTLDEVSGVKGVGTATMSALRDYASSTDWPPPPEECDTKLVARADAAASGIDRLLEVATKGDWPYAEIVTLKIEACLGMNDASGRDAVFDLLVESKAIDWAYGPGVYPVGDDFTKGSAQFLKQMGIAKQAIEDASGVSYFPENAEDQALLDSLDSMYSTLTSGPAANPTHYYETVLVIEAEECSQYAPVLVDPSNGYIWIVHRYPRC